MPVSPDFYHVIASVAREEGHAYRNHVLGRKGDSHGFSEFNSAGGSYGNQIPIESGVDLASFILDKINDVKTRGFYNTKNHSVTLVNTEDNVLVLFNNSPKYGDAGTVFRPYNESGSLNITANKYKEKLHLARAMKGDGIIIQGNGPRDLRAFVQMFADNTDFSKRPSQPIINAQKLNNDLITNSDRRSTLDLMGDNRSLVVALKQSDLTNDNIIDPPEKEVPRIEKRILGAESKVLDEKQALIDKQRADQSGHGVAKHLNDSIITALKNGAEVEDMGHNVILVATKIDDKDVYYSIKMASDGKSAELSEDDTPEGTATLTTASRLNALKCNVTQADPTFATRPEWGNKVDGKPLSWLKKTSAVLLLASLTSLGAGGQSADPMYAAHDKTSPSSINFNDVAKSTEGDLNIHNIQSVEDGWSADISLMSLASLVDAQGIDVKHVDFMNTNDSEPEITDELIV